MIQAQVPGNRRLTLVATALVAVLAAASLLLPHDSARPGSLSLLVFDPVGDPARLQQVYAPLAEVLAGVVEQPVNVRVFARAQELLTAAAERDCLVFCPDGLAMRLDRVRYAPVAAVRRPAPRNLRPRGVLVHRRSEPPPAAPWYSHGDRTVLGDSLCLSAVGGWALNPETPAPRRLPASGPDPFDHGPALHALRLGGFDYALVRQWDAERFLDIGLLDPRVWTSTPVTPPLPDLVVVAPRDLSTARRVAMSEALTRVGRGGEDLPPAALALRSGLERMNLSGFNPLMEPDVDRLRRSLRTDWPRVDE